MDNNYKQFQVSRIAFLNPYLAAGHFQTAEIESTARLVQAAKNLSIEVKVFGECNEIDYFSPDFVLTISFQAPKLTRYPTYGLMDVPPSLIKDVPRFVRNVLSYDGYLTISTSAVNWLKQLCDLNNKKTHIAHAAFSVPKTEFKKCHFKDAVAMYIGTNWDGSRHSELFKYLSTGEYLKCYGPAHKWAHYPPALYAGSIPFDGTSVLDAYHKSSAGLCIGHPTFDQEGVPSSRTFEIAAASALPLCSDIELNRSIYGDSALYINNDVNTHELAEQIITHVQWIRSHCSQAQEMAYHAHQIFLQQLSMESYLNNLIEMHKRVLIENHHVRATDHFSQIATAKKSAPKKPKITYILAIKYIDYRIQPVLSDILNQTYDDIDVVLLAQNGLGERDKFFSGFKFKVTCIPYHGIETNMELYRYLKENGSMWLGILTFNDRIFPNHSSILIRSYFENEAEPEAVIAGLFAGSLEFTNDLPLSERLLDEHRVPNKNKSRVGYLQFDLKMPLNSILINVNLLEVTFLERVDFYNLKSEELMNAVVNLGKFVQACEVTSAINIEPALLIKTLECSYEQERIKLQQQINDLQKNVANQEHTLRQLPSLSVWKFLSFIKRIIDMIKRKFLGAKGLITRK